MGLHEKMKHSIIAEEIIGYFLEKHVAKMNISIDIEEPQTKFVVTVPSMYKTVVTEMDQNLYCNRDKELEEYGWELFMDNKPTELLQSLGMLIDEYQIREHADVIDITFIRFH